MTDHWRRVVTYTLAAIAMASGPLMLQHAVSFNASSQ